MDTIIVPVDGASNIKLDVYAFQTLVPIRSFSCETPVVEIGGYAYNASGREFAWFDESIGRIPRCEASCRVIAPVARGASGGLVGHDNTLTEAPGEDATLSYSQDYPDRVGRAFDDIAGDEESFYLETGSIRSFPGSLTLLKRFVFEEMERPDVLERSACFGTYGLLMSGHFMGGDYRACIELAGNEHSYWMCHTGARDIRANPGTPSRAAAAIESFRRLVPGEPFFPYKPLGAMPENQAAALGLSECPLVTPGGHDTCLSHIPIMATFNQAFRERPGTPVIHIDAGSWTMTALVGGHAELPADGFRRDIIVQGTVDGQPVVTARYGGGNDFRRLKKLVTERLGSFGGGSPDEKDLAGILDRADCFVLPNIHPVNHMSGPFPDLRGRIVNEDAFYSDPESAYIVSCLTTALTTAVQVEAMSPDLSIPLVLTAGGGRDPWFGRFLATVTGHDVYALFDCDGNSLGDTTSLGAAIIGKAAAMNIHPYLVDVSGICLSYHRLEPFGDAVRDGLKRYRDRFLAEIRSARYASAH